MTHTHTDVSTATHEHNHMHDTTTTTTTTHPAFQPYQIQMNTVVVASHSPLVAGKQVLNEHTIQSSLALDEHTTKSSLALDEHTTKSSLALDEHTVESSLVNEHTIKPSSLGHFNSVLFTSTEPHSPAEDREEGGAEEDTVLAQHSHRLLVFIPGVRVLAFLLLP